jgi:hypothetical protein
MSILTKGIEKLFVQDCLHPIPVAGYQLQVSRVPIAHCQLPVGTNGLQK